MEFLLKFSHDIDFLLQCQMSEAKLVENDLSIFFFLLVSHILLKNTSQELYILYSSTWTKLIKVLRNKVTLDDADYL